MKRAGLGLALLASAVLLVSRPAEAQGESAWVEVGRLYTGRPGEVLEPAYIRVEGGRVAGVYAKDAVELPVGARVIDRSHLVAAPGFVAAEVMLDGGARAADTASARFQAVDAVDLYAEQGRLLRHGITTAFVHPGRGRLITGEGAVVKLAGDPLGRVLRRVAGLCVDFGPAALDPPARVELQIPSTSADPLRPGEPQGPTSPLGVQSELRARWIEALRYDQARQGADRPAFDADLAAMADALLEGRVRIEANRAEDLRAALDLAEDLGLEPVFSGCAEAHQLPDDVAGTSAGVVYALPGRLLGRGADRGAAEASLDVRLDTPRRLARAGATLALATQAGDEAELRLAAALAVRGGLSEPTALAAITRNAAQVLGVGARVGTLAPGFDADFVLLDGAPLATRTHVIETWVDGRVVYRAPGVDAVVVRAGTVWTAAGEPIAPGEVLVRGGAIAAVGSSVPHPPGARVIDAGPDGYVTPGFVDAYGHLGLMGDTDAPKSEVPLHAVVGGDDPEALRVARAGVTTVVMAPWRVHMGGSRLAARKTAAWDPDDPRGGMILREIAGVVFDLRDGDPLEVPRLVRARAQAGQAYHQRWQEYAQKVADWEAKQAAEAEAAAREAEEAARKAEEEAAREAEEDAEGEDEPEEEWFDPISGTWSTRLSGPPLPEPQDGLFLLRLEEDRVTIRGEIRDPNEPGSLPLSGTLDGTHVSLVLEVETPVGQPRIEAELDGEDHMAGTLALGPFNIQYEATRTERTPPEIKLPTRRQSRDGRPLPPPVDASLEPWRQALDGVSPVVFVVNRTAAVEPLLEFCAEVGVPAVFVGLETGERVAEALQRAGSGVVVWPERQAREGRTRWVPAVRLEEARVRMGFMSGAEDGAAELPLRALVAVHRGVSEGAALAALTIEPARLFRLDDRVGSLEVGKDGDLVVFDGPPFEASSRVLSVVVNGRVLEADDD